MKAFFGRDLPPRASIAVCALVLLASVVAGREEGDAPPPPPSPSSARDESSKAVPPARQWKPSAQARLEIEKLARPKREETIPDLFTGQNWVPKPSAAPATTRPARAVSQTAPVPPPLPFRYLGRMIDAGRVVVFLEKGGENYSVAEGESLGSEYRVERITDSAVSVVYVPLGALQSFPVAPNR